MARNGKKLMIIMTEMRKMTGISRMFIEQLALRIIQGRAVALESGSSSSRVVGNILLCNYQIQS